MERLAERRLLSVAPDPGFGPAHDGKVTTEFFNNLNASEQANAIAVQTDGKLVVGASDGSVIRYMPTGDVDSSFGEGGMVRVHGQAMSIGLQFDGKILVAGQASNGRNTDFRLSRYNGNGTLDSSFGVGGEAITDFSATNDDLGSMVVQSDGRIVVSGRTHNGANYDFALARQVSGFSGTFAYSTSPAIDSAFLSDSTGGAAFIVRPEYALVTGPDGVRFASGFDTVSATGDTHKTDRAVLYDSVFDDTLLGVNDLVRLTTASGSDYFLNRFSEVRVVANAGGRDQARFTAPRSECTFVASPTYAYLQTDASLWQVDGFESVKVNGYGIGTAYFHDSADVDLFETSATNFDSARMTGNGYDNAAFSFRAYHAYATPGRHDEAYLDNSFFADTIYVDTGAVTVSSQRLTFSAHGFNAINVAGPSGPTDDDDVIDLTTVPIQRRRHTQAFVVR